MRRPSAVVSDSPGGKRDRAVIVTMVLTGLRRSEILNIRAGDRSRNFTGGRRMVFVRSFSYHQSHRRIHGKSLGVVGVFVSGETTVGRLP